MAEVSDLTTAQLETLVSVDFNGMFKTLHKVLARVVSANDDELDELNTLKNQLLSLETIILASGNTAAVTADAILNP